MTSEVKPAIDLYTDGSTKVNPGEGGWGYVMLLGDTRKEGSGYDPATTNNRMEASAVLYALKALPRSCKVTVFSDSQYVIKGLSNWKIWKKRPDLKNKELWIEIHEEVQKHEIISKWVRGHDGNVENERAHVLAHEAARKMDSK